MAAQPSQQQQPPVQLPASNGFSLDAPLAMPLSNNSNGSSQNSSQQSQYSPQASLYQQQLIKSAQQFIPAQQQAAAAAAAAAAASTRHLLLNGINATQHHQSQENSPNNNPQQSIYNHTVSRQIQQQQSIYGAKAAPVGVAPGIATTYYQAHQQQQVQPLMNGTSTQAMAAATASPQLYQAQAQRSVVANGGLQYYATQPQPTSQPQQQHSPASLMFAGQAQPNLRLQQQQPSQLPTTNSLVNLSPAQQQQQQQQQSYLNSSWSHPINEAANGHQQMNTNTYNQPPTNQMQLQIQQLQQQQATNNVWPSQVSSQPQQVNNIQQQQQQISLDAFHHQQQQQQLLLQQQQQQQIQQAQQQLHHNQSSQMIPSQRKPKQMSSNRHFLSSNSHHFSDRDSISTVSRLGPNNGNNLLNDIDRRSFTMRSQFTSYQSSKPNSNSPFGFIQLTSEAIRHLLGFSDVDNKSREPLINVSPQSSAQQVPNNEQQNALKQQQGSRTNNSNPITAIDSGDDYYFKKKVFKYELIIVRLINLLLSAFVLLSPVVMLLLPKMESLLSKSASSISDITMIDSIGNNGQTASTNAASGTTPAGSNAIFTNGVGLNHKLSLGNKNLMATGQQQQPQWRIGECLSSDCDGPIIGFVLRLFLLSIAHWAIFFRQRTCTLPRVDFHRCFLITLALLITMAYWLFFIFRVFDKRYNDFELQYMTIIQFSISMLETLILLHYLALVLLELRQRKKVYCLKVVRSPDGESKYYSCGLVSIQQCAQIVLEKYHQNFKHYDSYSEQLLSFEDELAQTMCQDRKSTSSNNNNNDQQHQRHHRSRANSPAFSRDNRSHRNADCEEDDDDDLDDGDRDATGVERSSRRRHSSAHRRHHRRASRSSRANNNNDNHRSDDDDYDDETRRNNNNDNNEDNSEDQKRVKKQTSSTNNKQQTESPNNNNNRSVVEHNIKGCGDLQSSDDAASSGQTAQAKESSLETVRAAIQDVPAPNANNINGVEKVDLEINEVPKQQVPKRQVTSQHNEAESVRSARSRRSTASRLAHKRRDRDHHSENRHDDHHRGGSSSRHHHERWSSRSRTRRDNAADHHEDSFEAHHHQHQHQHQHHYHHQEQQDNPLEEHERKLRRRRLRLLASVEDAFKQIKQLDEETILQQQQQQHLDSANVTVPSVATVKPPIGMDANQAARSLYPSLARSLQKYLRLTKQTGRHNLQSIYEHLSKCLMYKLNARAFLEKFVNLDPIWQQNETKLFAQCRMQHPDALVGATGGSPNSLGYKQMKYLLNRSEPEINSWSLICDTLSSRQIDSGTYFLLKQGQVSLLVTVAKLPHLNLNEQVIDYNLCRFQHVTAATDA